MSRTSESEAESPTAILRADHVVILRAVAVLERLADDLRRHAPVDRSALTWLIDFFQTFVDGCHHRKEEQHLFPALERHGIPRQGGPIGVMLDEHEAGRILLQAIADGDATRRADAIERYATLLRLHIDKENGILFRLADMVIPGPEQRRLLAAFEAVEGEALAPGRHERLLAELARLEATRRAPDPS